MIRWILRQFGFYKIDYGLACGRHWMEIDGQVIAQTESDAVWLRDEDVVWLVKGTLGAPEWTWPGQRRPIGGVNEKTFLQ